MNTNFSEAVNKYATLDKGANKAFGFLSAFAYDVIRSLTGDSEAVANVLGNSIKAEETAYRTEYNAKHPKAPLANFPAAYRSAKSTIVSAVKAGVSLVDADGQLHSKGDLIALTKQAVDPKSELEKFTSTIATATKIFAKIDSLDDVRKAKALVVILADQVMKAEAHMGGGKHREKAPMTEEEKKELATLLKAA